MLMMTPSDKLKATLGLAALGTLPLLAACAKKAPPAAPPLHTAAARDAVRARDEGRARTECAARAGPRFDELRIRFTRM